MKEASEKDKESEKAESDATGKDRTDQVTLSQAGEATAESGQKTVAELSGTTAYRKDEALIPKAETAVSFSATA